jgi:hypothetical protein
VKSAGIGANTNVELDDDGLEMIRENVANGFERENSSPPPSQENQDLYGDDDPFQSNRGPDNIAPTRSSVTGDHFNSSRGVFGYSPRTMDSNDQEDRRYPRTSSPNYAGYQRNNSTQFSFNGNENENDYDDNSRSMEDNFGLNRNGLGKFC